MKKKLLIFIILSIFLLSSVTAQYWRGTVWDTDPEDGMNDFNPENNPYYLNLPYATQWNLDKWYWCEGDEEIWMTTDTAPDSWRVESCDDKCHFTRQFRTSAKDPSDFVDVTWCGSTNVASVCDYPYGKGAQCDGNEWYTGLCVGKTDNARCDNCILWLDTVKCDGTNWAYCLNEKVDSTDSLVYVCDYSSSGECDEDTIKKFESSEPNQIILAKCEKEASNMNDNSYVWQFTDDCSCLYAPKKLGVASYETSEDCRDINADKITEYLDSGVCGGGLFDIPWWGIILGIILAIIFFIWLLSKI